MIVNGVVVEENVAVTVYNDDETVTVIISILLGEVEPVVRLNII